MNTRITGPIKHRYKTKEVLLETQFYTLQDFMTFTKGITYLLMGGILVFMPLFWYFLTGRDKD